MKARLEGATLSRPIDREPDAAVWAAPGTLVPAGKIGVCVPGPHFTTE